MISPKRLKEFSRTHPDARDSLNRWRQIVEEVQWNRPVETKETFRSADQVVTDNGNTVTVFNIAGNKYRMITTIHYKSGIVYILKIMAHAEYDKNAWKREL